MLVSYNVPFLIYWFNIAIYYWQTFINSETNIYITENGIQLITECCDNGSELKCFKGLEKETISS